MIWQPVASFFVPGEPKGQPRARAFAKPIGGGKFSARVYDPGTAEGWKNCIAIAATPFLPPMPLGGPIRLDADFLLPRPQCMGRKRDPDGEVEHTKKPDRDNLEKSTLDCLKQLGFMADDCQVCCGEVRKFYVAKGGVPGARLRIAVKVEEPRITTPRGRNPGGAASSGHTTTVGATAEVVARDVGLFVGAKGGPAR